MAKIAHIIDILLNAFFGLIYIKMAAGRASIGVKSHKHDTDPEALKQRTWVLFLGTAVQCFISAMLAGMLMLDQGWTRRSDGIRTDYARWIQLALCGFATDMFLYLFYPQAGRFPGHPGRRVLGRRMDHEPVHGALLGRQHVLLVRARRGGPDRRSLHLAPQPVHQPALQQIHPHTDPALPDLRRPIVTAVLSPSGVHVMGEAVTEYLYLIFNLGLVVLIGSIVGFTFPNAAIENAALQEAQKAAMGQWVHDRV